MPDATITSTASTFGTITGTFSADQSTITGTITGTVVGTLTGSVGVPGPAGPAGVGLPAGGTSGQFLQKTSGADYATDWVTVNLTGLATESWVTAGFYPLTGNPSNFLTASALTPYLTKADNLGSLTNFATARSNLGLGSLDTPTFAGVNVPGSGTSVANLGATSLTINQQGSGQFTIQPSQGIVFPDATVQTTAYPGPAGATAWGTITGTLSSQTDLQSALDGKASSARGLPAGGEDGQIIVKDGSVDYATIWTDNSADTLTVRATNKTGSTLNKGSVVRINGAQGQRPTIALAQGNSGASADGVIGILLATLANNATGLVCTAGLAKRLDTSAYTEGVKLFLSPSVAGGLTPTRPSAPDHAVAVGIVSHSSATTGSIEVNVVVGDHLEWLHDVLITTPTNGQVLKYDSAAGLWVNGTDVAPVTSVAGRTGAVTLAVADVSGAAPIASPALTGNVTITSNSTGAALFIEQAGTGNILTLHDQASDTNFVAIDQNGKVNTVASVTAHAGFNVPHGTAPTSPVNGDVWTTTSGLFMRQNGTTQQYVDLAGTQTINGTKTFSAASLTLGNATAAGTIAIGSGATVSGSTRTIAIGTASAAGSTNTINIGGGSGTSTTTLNGTTNFTGPITGAINNITLGNGTAASAFNLFTGATVSGSTKAVAIATGGAAGSTTTVTIGNTTGSTTTLQGTTNGVTAAADTNSVALATTAYVVGQAGSATPLVNGTAAVGTSLRYARQDHVHPTDTSRAALASPTFSGTPLSTTAAVDTNTTQIATTAFVLAQAAAATPLVDGTAAVGTSTRYARADHVHPTDTTRAPLNSPSFSGTPSLPTGTTAVTQTAGNNTTAVATTAFVTAAVPALATLTDSRQLTNDTKAMSPNDVLWAMMTQDYIDINRSGFTYTTAGTPQFNDVGSVTQRARLNATVASSVIGRPFGTSQVDQTSPFLFRNNWSSNINFNLKTYLSGRAGSFSLLSDPAFNQAFWYGKIEGDALGALTRRGFGWAWSGGTGSRFVNLVVHNGTTLTTVASSFAVTQEIAFDWDLYSDGAGNVTLYINGSQVATSSAGPTSYQSAGTYAWWREEAYTTAAPTFGNHTSYFTRGRAMILNY
jgi:hypothetical protein